MAQTTRLASFGPFFVFVGLHWPLLAVIGYSMATVGLCGPALAFVGCRWLLWAFVGLRWPALAAVGFCGPVLAFGGRRWLLWAFVVNKMEEKFEKKNTPRAQTTPDASFGPFFIFVGLCWPLLAVIGYSMATVGLCGPALAFVGCRWLLWAFVVNKMEEKK